jgi:hypothetical protein
MSQLQQALKVLADAMQPGEQFNNADGDLARKLHDLMATKSGRAKLRAALAEIEDDATDEDEEIDEEVTANARTTGWGEGYFATGVKTRTALVHNNADDAPLGMPPATLLAKPAKKAGGAK